MPQYVRTYDSAGRETGVTGDASGRSGFSAKGKNDTDYDEMERKRRFDEWTSSIGASGLGGRTKLLQLHPDPVKREKAFREWEAKKYPKLPKPSPSPIPAASRQAGALEKEKE